MQSYEVTPALLEEIVWRRVERNDFRLKVVHLSPFDYNSLQKNGQPALDVVTSYQVMKMGILAQLWGAEVRVARENKRGEVRFEDDRGNVGTVCLSCKNLFDGESCPSDLCVVRYVLES